MRKLIYILLLVPLLSFSQYNPDLLQVSLYQATPASSGWERKHPITIQSSQVVGSGSHTNFPVLITLDNLNTEVVDNGSNSAKVNGDDIIFTSDGNSDGSNRLSCQIVEFVADATGGNRRCQIWVKIPSLSTSTNTTIYIHYKNPSATQPASDAVYGSESVWTNYDFVSHNIKTEASNGYTITLNNEAANVAGKFTTNVSDFNGTTNYHTTGLNSIDFTTARTISFWFNYDDTSTFKRMMQIKQNSPDAHIQFVKNGDFIIFGVHDNDAADIPNTRNKVNSSSISSGSWYHTVATYANLTSSPTLRINKTNQTQTDANTLSPGSATTNQLWFGMRSDSSGYYNGKLQTLKIASTTLSSDYTDTEYNNQNSPSTFAIEGSSTDD